ncbi:hypothetical protein CHS0354_025034 [Potamilus streckersoni]|uniref:Ig-like domain-containing protein n=1 Tax=Potamilus streckersoni TaxID=2493646 RepID=A0AAE0WA23_9BIVA|nr:hypothetical protein CHS0354_025034 [Potamilus streckersoni]
MWELAMFMILGMKEGLSIQPSPIIFDRTPVNVTVIAGNTAVLPCIVENRGEQQIIWMTPQRILISTEDRRVIDDMRMSIERPFVRDWNLHIRSVELKDNGIYTCQVNTNPIQIKRIHLNVLVPASIVDETSSHDIEVREWETVQLTCNATGVPEPSVSWYRHTEQLAKEQVGTVGEILLIHNISRYCGGVYECVADNDLTEPAVKEIRVDVEFAPEVELRTSRIGQYRGRETILECLVTAFPQANCLWKKGDTPVSIPPSNSWKYRTELYKENDHTVALYLRIINLEEADYGLYTCEASNRLGRDSRDMFLYEYLDPTTRRPSTKAPTPNGIEPVKLTPRHNDIDDESLYIDKSDRLQTSSNPFLLRPGHYQKPQEAFNTGYAGAGDRYINGSSLSMLNPLLLFTSTILFSLLVSSEFPFRR